MHIAHTQITRTAGLDRLSDWGPIFCISADPRTFLRSTLLFAVVGSKIGCALCHGSSGTPFSEAITRQRMMVRGQRGTPGQLTTAIHPSEVLAVGVGHSSTLRRRLAVALPALISISNSDNRSRPSASRFFALSAVFAATRSSHAVSENVADGNPSAFTGMVLDGALSSAIGLMAEPIEATERRRRNR